MSGTTSPTLVVNNPFLSYSKGDTITDSGTILYVLANYGQDVLVSAQLVTAPGRAYLVVTSPFSTYTIGEEITDPTTIAFVTTYYAANVKSVLSTSSSIVVNTPPTPGSDVFATFDYVQDAILPVTQVGNAAFNLAVAASLQSSNNTAQVAQVGTPTGVWNAAANSPVFSAGGAGGHSGQASVVSAPGSTSLDGNAVWQLGDVVYNTGTSWVRFPFGGASGVLSNLLMPKQTFSYDGTSDGTKKLADQYGNVMAQWTSAGLQTTGLQATTLALSGAATMGGSLTAANLAASGATTTGSVALPRRLLSDNGQTPGSYAHMILDQYGNVVFGIGVDGTVHMPGIVASEAGVTLINPLLNSITINGATAGLPLLATDAVAQTVTLAGTRVLSVDLNSTNSYELRDKYGFIISAVDHAGVGTGLLSEATSSTGGGTGPSSAYSPAMAAQRDAMNVALSTQWKTERMSRYLPLTGNVIHFFGYGQSLSGGWYGVPVLNTTQPYDSVMIGTQTRAVANTTTTINWVPVGTPTSSAGSYAIYPFNPMIATVSSEFVPAQGETPTETAINFLRRAYLQMHGKAADPNCIFMLTNTGIGGRTIAQLSKGASPELFNRNRDAANYVKAACIAAGKSYQVGGVVWTQGENDVLDGTTYATYTAEFKQLQADFLTDIVVGIAGQAGPIPWFCHQPDNNGTGYLNDVAQSLSDMAATFGSDVYLGGPVSQYPDHSEHLTANGYRWHGNQVGKAMERVILRQTNHRGCFVRRATYLGTSILIDVNVPEPPLQQGDSYSQYVLTLYQNSGLIVSDSLGQVAISAVTLMQSTIRLDLFRALGSSPVLTVGLTPLNGEDIGTNICDSDPAYAIANYTYTAGVQDAGENIASWNGRPLIGQPYPLQNYLAMGDNIPVVADPIYT